MFDVGANVGDTTEAFTRCGATVVAFEPNPECVDRLRRRFAGRDQVTIEPCGVSSTGGHLELAVCDAADTLSTFSGKWQTGRFSSYAWNRNITVPVITLDDALERHGVPTFIKIDVEGFELEVLAGLSVLPSYLCLEYTSEFSGDAVAAVERLSGIGSCRFALSPGETGRLASEYWLSASSVANALMDLTGDSWGDLWMVRGDMESATAPIPLRLRR